MLNVKALYATLSQMVSTNIEQAVICNEFGDIISCAGNDKFNGDAISSLLSKMWTNEINEIILEFDVC